MNYGRLDGVFWKQQQDDCAVTDGQSLKCDTCEKLVLASDYDKHMDTHSGDDSFPKLG